MSTLPNSLPLVSICIPAYNGEDFIKEAIACAQQQTYAPLEIIITDDCSTDATLTIAQKAAAADERIKVFSNPVNQGLIGNWQSCVQHSGGAWIKFLFQDDTMKPTCVEAMMQTALQHDAKVCVSARSFIINEQAHPGLKRFFEQDIITPQHLFIKKNYYTAAEMALVLTPHLQRNVLGEPSTWLMHREVFEQGFAFNKRMSQLMDYEFLVNAVFKYGLAFVREELVAFRVHDKSESNRNVNDAAAAADVKKMIRAHTGDYMEMILAVLQQPLWQPLLKAWGAYRLRIFFERLYIKACRDYGEQLTREALHTTLSSALFTIRPYSFLHYVLNKIQFNYFVKPMLAKRVLL
jgi:glycosyltransferase involved in cell wall biosynthesis